MLRVSVSLFALRRAISSLIFTSESSPTKRSSSIFASSSAMGCSKPKFQNHSCTCRAATLNRRTPALNHPARLFIA
jgi:hypothetical protein